MGCGGSEEGEQGEEHSVVVEEEQKEDLHAHQIQIELYIKNDENAFVKQSLWCEPEMLFLGLVEQAIGMGGWAKDVELASVELALPGLDEPLNMITANHSLSYYNAKFKEKSCNVYAYLKDSTEFKDAQKLVTELPGSIQPKLLPELELHRRTAQFQVRVFAAVPACPDDEHFGKSEACDHCVEDGKATVYEAKLWATNKVVVGAIVDAANTAISKLTNGVSFGGGDNTVVSYILGVDKPDEEGDDVLLGFEMCDEIEDVDGFEANKPNLQFVVYNEATEGAPACDAKNYWGVESMLHTYFIKHKPTKDMRDRVTAGHSVEFEVPNWPELISKHI